MQCAELMQWTNDVVKTPFGIICNFIGSLELMRCQQICVNEQEKFIFHPSPISGQMESSFSKLKTMKHAFRSPTRHSSSAPKKLAHSLIFTEKTASCQNNFTRFHLPSIRNLWRIHFGILINCESHWRRCQSSFQLNALPLVHCPFCPS